MADGDETRTNFDVRLDWPDDDLRDASIGGLPQGSTAPDVPPSATTDGHPVTGDKGLVGVVAALVRQVEVLTVAVEQGVADIRFDARENSSAVRRLAGKLKDTGASRDNESLTELLNDVVGAVNELHEAVEDAGAKAQANADAIAELRSAIENLPEPVAVATEPSAPIDGLEEVVAGLDAMKQTLGEALGVLHEDMVQLKRRIAVRTGAQKNARDPDEEVGRIVAGVISGLEELIEVVPGSGDTAPSPSPPAAGRGRSSPRPGTSPAKRG